MRMHTTFLLLAVAAFCLCAGCAHDPDDDARYWGRQRQMGYASSYGAGGWGGFPSFSGCDAPPGSFNCDPPTPKLPSSFGKFK